MKTSLLDVLTVAESKSRKGGVPLFRQIAEMAYLMLFHRIGPGYYLMARFWRREMKLSDKIRHWNGDRYLRFVHKINDPRYFKISQNKLVEKALLTTLKIPTVPLVGLFHAGKGQCADGFPLVELADLARVFDANRGRGLFFKPAEGDCGRGVFSLWVTEEDGRTVLRDPLSNETVSAGEALERLRAAPEGFLVEHAIEQHPDLARLNPSSVNTLRIWVVHDREGVRVVGAFLRVGRAGSLVDNTAGGGLACPIDLDTGVVSRALDLTLERNEYTVHPDSGEQLVGIRLPYWNECVRIACNALRVLPGATFSGMDIAVSTSGPLVVEYNVEANQRGAAHFDVPHAAIFSGFGRPARDASRAEA